MTKINLSAVVIALAGLTAMPVSSVEAQSFECDNRFGPCGTPEFSGGGGCGCGGGSILIANTDLGDTYQNADDFDNDGIEDPFDNCVRFYNVDQADSDGDLIGDACDNCLATANEDQFDLDGDLVGNACDDDMDGDTILNALDNCELVPNPIATGKTTQDDFDGDGIGDVCDADIDGDAILNTEDDCPFLVGSGDTEACFPDSDGDGISEVDPLSPDLCPTTFDPEQLDTDADLIGDACDTDKDGDNVLNLVDNCELLANPMIDGAQPDADRDGRGDLCDDSYCFVVFGDEANCLDPSAAIDAYVPRLLTDAGAEVRLPLFVNRVDQDLSYTWTVVESPAGSNAVVANASGASDASIDHEVVYSDAVTFTPDLAGAYTLRVVVTTNGADNVNGQIDASTSYDVDFVAQGVLTESGDCAAGGSPAAGASFFLMFVAALGALRRRRQ